MDRSICDFISKPEKKDLEKDILSALVNEEGGGLWLSFFRIPSKISGQWSESFKLKKKSPLVLSPKNVLTNKQKCVFIAGDETTGIFTEITSKGMETALASQTSEAVKLINQSGWIGIALINQEEDGHSLSKGMDVGHIPQRISTLLGRDGVYLD